MPAPLPLPVQPAPNLIDADLAPLLTPTLADACAASAPSAPADALRARLLARVSASRADADPMATARRARTAAVTVADGVQARVLYRAKPGRAPRPGEPLQARLIELRAGGHWVGPGDDSQREWLVVQGDACIGGTRLQARDYLVLPAGVAAPAVSSTDGAVLFLRESTPPRGDTGRAPVTVRDDEAGWPEFAPGIRRRVLWQHDGQAAMLYCAAPGARVPLHSHGHDEECLMVQGELYLDDVLLQAGDYQLAPAGTAHRLTETDTGAVLYAHGDLDLRF